MDIPKYFSNVVLAQFKATGIPLKVYVNGEYLIIPDVYEISDPLLGSGMTTDGHMVQFDYREIDHLLVGGNVLDLEKYTKAMVGDTPEGDKEEEKEEEEETTEESLDLGEITKDVFKARNKALDAEEKALKDKRKALDDEPIEDGVIKEDYDRDMDRKYGRDRDYTNIEVKDMHFQTDTDELEKMKLAYGYRLGGMTSREKIADADYELKRYRKEIKYGNGTDVDVFIPDSYDAMTSKLMNGPHQKARPKVNWNDRKYEEWIDSVAAEGGAQNAFDMAQNAKMEPGLIDWVKKNRLEFGDVTPLERIQYDIEAMAESVNEARGRAGEELSMIPKGRAKAALRQIKSGKRDDGMKTKSNPTGKFDAKLYGVDASGEEHEITDEDEINIYKKFGLRAIEESVNEGDGLWANIHAKRKRGERPARKGSKAYKAAKKAGDKINKESVKEDHMPGPPYEYDNVSEPYSIKVGDMIQNTNTSCPHHGSKGIVKQVMDMPNDIGKIVKYIVMNQGDNFNPGDSLTKTIDQLEPMR